MPSFKVKVKWGKELFENIELNTDETPYVFKAQIFALTNVSVERQKLMFKGKTIGDEHWNIENIKDGVTFLMMGTAEVLPAEPVEKTKFLEDMNEHELKQALTLPAGLTNIGNTCYLNATLQCLKTIPELCDAIKDYNMNQLNESSDSTLMLMKVLSDCYKSMEKCATVTPILLLQVFHIVFPRFAEKGEGGGFVQQDANECLVEIMKVLQRKLKSISNDETQLSASSSTNNLIEQYFGINYDITMKCNETEDEQETQSSEKQLQLSCFISQDTRYLNPGLKAKILEQITKYSPSLQRDAIYTKTSKISRLPAYLVVQFVRFQYKGNVSTNAKVLKDVKFGLNLDVYDLCTSELQEKLAPMRAYFKKAEDLKVELDSVVTTKPISGDNEVSKEKKDKYCYPFSFKDEIGSNNSGYYELRSVITHRGRLSNSGHYVAWVKHKGDEWFKCDDDEISIVNSDEILKLSGGGDWHCAYVLFYGPRILEVDKPFED